MVTMDRGLSLAVVILILRPVRTLSTTRGTKRPAPMNTSLRIPIRSASIADTKNIIAGHIAMGIVIIAMSAIGKTATKALAIFTKQFISMTLK